ncbi:hypothetical protein MAR_005200, partial [Mya arenaria]
RLTSEMSESIHSVRCCRQTNETLLISYLSNERTGNGFSYGNAIPVFYLRNTLQFTCSLHLLAYKKSTAGILIMSLAGTDILTCLLVMPFTKAVVYLN